MKHFISIIVPNYNGRQTIGMCLESIYAINDDDREVIVVDDCSEYSASDIIKRYPCKFIQLEKHEGASAARNAGARSCKGDVLFFIDADCLLNHDTLSIVRKHLAVQPAEVVIGGTYTPIPQDPGFFSQFQSAFVNYFETKNSGSPDYLATHALVIHAETFRKLGGFTENFLPILEDVEFCHRLRRAGYRLIMDPDLQVRHIFGYSFARSVRNAVRKTQYWIEYSLVNKDLFADSGTASREIKFSGVGWLTSVLLVCLFFLTGKQVFLVPLPLLWAAGIFVNRYLFKAFYRAGGAVFAVMAGMYYLMAYPAAIWIGAGKGAAHYLARKKRPLNQDDPCQLTSSGSTKG